MWWFTQIQTVCSLCESHVMWIMRWGFTFVMMFHISHCRSLLQCAAWEGAEHPDWQEKLCQTAVQVDSGLYCELYQLFLNERVNEQLNERFNEWMNEYICICIVSIVMPTELNVTFSLCVATDTQFCVSWTYSGTFLCCIYFLFLCWTIFDVLLFLGECGEIFPMWNWASHRHY